VLAPQFAFINALLGVRGDREKQPRVLRETTPTGDELIISKDGVRRAASSQVSKDETMRLQISLGGPEALRAITYVALTFFAHHFPDEAREDGLAPVKAFLQGEVDNTFAWWESNVTTDALPASPFPFGHTVVLRTVAATGDILAVVSFFQALTVAVDLGRLSNARDRTLVVFVDPHADHPPDDIDVRELEPVGFALEKPVPLHARLERMILGEGGEKLLQSLFAKIERRHFEEEMSLVLEQLNAAAPMQGRERLAAISLVLEGQAARLYRLMKFVVDDYAARSEEPDLTAPIVAVLRTQIAVDGDNALPGTEMTIIRVIVAFTREIHSRLSQGAIDMDFLWALFSTGKGLVIVGEVMFEPIRAALKSEAEQAH
jgi:hypothetical protein